MLTLLFRRKKLLSDPKLLGRWGERRAEKFLSKKGLRTLCRNFSCKAGEIDLVMTDPSDRTVIFVEVKTRTSENYFPAQAAVTLEKQRRIAASAKWFLKIYDIHDRPTRFDCVALALGPKGPPEIRHFEHAFIA
jgi:putative endonuclease